MRVNIAAKLTASIAVSVAMLVGCAAPGRAPIEARRPAQQTQGLNGASNGAPAVARPGYYIVRRGDTLFSIAHQFERDYREVAAWNELEDANVIEVGQELRVTPPDSVASRVVTPAPSMVTRPIDSPPAIAVPEPSEASGPGGGVKVAPRGGRIAYSVQAWKNLQAAAKAAPTTAGVPQSAPVTSAKTLEPATVAAARTPQSAPVANASEVSASAGKSDAKTATQSGPAAAGSQETKAASNSEDGVEWAWPGAGKVVGTFNDSSNKGVDIAGNLGDPVTAAGSGRVVYVGAGLRGYGNLVIIKHNNNFLSAYAHNSEILVKEGQSVQKGQKIAAVGSSDADRPKLHFEIRRQGKPVDPLKYLPSR